MEKMIQDPFTQRRRLQFMFKNEQHRLREHRLLLSAVSQIFAHNFHQLLASQLVSRNIQRAQLNLMLKRGTAIEMEVATRNLIFKEPLDHLLKILQVVF